MTTGSWPKAGEEYPHYVRRTNRWAEPLCESAGVLQYRRVLKDPACVSAQPPHCARAMLCGCALVIQWPIVLNNQWFPPPLTTLSPEGLSCRYLGECPMFGLRPHVSNPLFHLARVQRLSWPPPHAHAQGTPRARRSCARAHALATRRPLERGWRRQGPRGPNAR